MFRWESLVRIVEYDDDDDDDDDDNNNNKRTYLLTYLLTYSLCGAGCYLKSW
jgi:hypothetical protein